MHGKIQLIPMQNAKVSESRQVEHRKSHWQEMGKIMAKLKHNYNSFPELQTKFFHKQCVIWSFLPSFNEFHHKLYILKNFRYICTTITNEEKSYNICYLPVTFPKYNKTSPKVSLFLRDQRYSDAWKKFNWFRCKMQRFYTKTGRT